MADPLVSEWHCRDLDSRISQRELAAVEEWQTSGHIYHVMRDNRYHVATIVGCCFGMKNPSSGANKELFKSILDYVKFQHFKGLDQNALHAVLWPQAKKDMVAHDSYLCLQYPTKFNRPWPSQRLSGPNFTMPQSENFVGANGGRISLQNHGACPLQCRPQNHQDWILC